MLRIIEQRTTRFLETRDKIEDLAHELTKLYNREDPDYEEFNEITKRLCSICAYVDEVLPIVQDRIEEEALTAVI